MKIKIDKRRNVETAVSKHSKQSYLIIGLAITVLALLGALGFLGLQYLRAQDEADAKKEEKAVEANAETELQKETERKREEAQKLVLSLSDIYLLPDEEPTVATIVNIDKLKSSEKFYENGRNGDKLLIFVKNRLAILYRSEENKIINVSSVEIPEGLLGGDSSGTEIQ